MENITMSLILGSSGESEKSWSLQVFEVHRSSYRGYKMTYMNHSQWLMMYQSVASFWCEGVLVVLFNASAIWVAPFFAWSLRLHVEYKSLSMGEIERSMWQGSELLQLSRPWEITSPRHGVETLRHLVWAKYPDFELLCLLASRPWGISVSNGHNF